jgi:hypothetical protein
MRVKLTKASRRIGLIAAAALAVGCDSGTVPTGPAEIRAPNLEPSAIVVTPGLSVYTDRASWEAAVVAAGGTVVNMDFAGLTLGRVTQLDTDYGAFRIVVDDVATDPNSNPGISIAPDAGCSLGTGDCDIFTFNMYDPTSVLDGPKFNSLIFPQNIVAFGGDFIQAGVTAPTGTPTGPVSLRIGTETFVINTYVDASGNGFVGFVADASNIMNFTFLKSGSLQNDILQVYNPAYANQPAGGSTPEEDIEDLQTTIGGLSLPAGLGTAFNSKLNDALAALGVGNTAGACASLQALINQLNAQSGKKISASSAAALIAEVEAIRTDLGC